MSSFNSIFLPLSHDIEIDKLTRLSVWLAKRVSAKLTASVMHDDPRERARLESSFQTLADVLTRQEGVGDVRLIPAAEKISDPIDEALAIVKREKLEMIVSLLRWSRVGGAAVFDPATASLVEQSPVPVLVVPENHRPKLPWSNILVPMSAESRTNPALKHALSLALQLGLDVDVVHVAPCTGDEQRKHTLLSRYSDSAYHDFPERVEQLITEASPFSSVEEKQRIRHFTLCCGEVSEEVLEQARHRDCGIIAMQWKGTLKPGHARILKTVLQESACPLLLVRAESQRQCKLTAGGEIAA